MAGGRRPGTLGKHQYDKRALKFSSFNSNTFSGIDAAARSSDLPGSLGGGFHPAPTHAARFLSINNASRVVSRTSVTASSMVWPPATHDLLVDKAFSKGLTQDELFHIKRGSRHTDAAYGVVPVTLIVSNAYKHAMTPCGMKKEDAIKKAHEFIIGKWEEARKLQAEYLLRPTSNSPFAASALFAFGEGAHTYMDNTSPAHNYFQEYCYPEIYDNPTGVDDEIIEGVKYYCEMRQHSQDESHTPTPEEEKATVEILHVYFRHTFDESGLQIALGTAPRPPRPPGTGPIPSPHPTPSPTPRTTTPGTQQPQPSPHPTPTPRPTGSPSTQSRQPVPSPHPTPPPKFR